MSNLEKISDYDSEPVVYCSKCYSLKIKYEEAIDVDCCMDCGCSDISTTTIDEWEKLYERRYGHKFVERNNKNKNSYIYKLSIDELKSYVYKSLSWKNIVKELYPAFPEGMSKSDTVILLFDKLIKDNRLNDLRQVLTKYFKI